MLDMLEVIEPSSIDSIVTDPPYGLTTIVDRFGKEGSAPAKEGTDGSFARLSRGFMGKEWDGSGVEYNVDAWRKCYTVLKPGGYLLAFGGTRTFHRIACAIEDAGFEIRDTILWLYGSGFPKSLNIGLAIDKKNGVDNRTGEIRTDGKATNSGSGCYNCNTEGENSMQREFEERVAQNEWAGWGTALKPAYEPIIVARKPCEGSCVDNVLTYGVGGINIDDCRIPTEEEISNHSRSAESAISKGIFGNSAEQETHQTEGQQLGRYPSNVVLTYDTTDFNEVCGGMPVSGQNGTISREYDRNVHIIYGKYEKITPFQSYEDSGSASRYYYCAKASGKDRDEGLEAFATKPTGELQGGRQEGSAGSIMQNADGTTRVNPYAGTGAPKKNTHPTVKPCELMQYLVRLVTPKGGTVLDPFNGSGSTGKACMYENRERQADYKYIGIELTAEYLPIADARISVIANQAHKRRLI